MNITRIVTSSQNKQNKNAAVGDKMFHLCKHLLDQNVV